MKISFGSEFKQKTRSNVQKFTLKGGEQARVCIIDEGPEVGYVHTLNKIIIDENGEIVTEERTNKDGGIYSINKTDYVGKYLCKGDVDTVIKTGADTENCVMCKAASESNAIAPAQRRYAVNVLRYTTKPNSYVPKEPLQMSVLPWEFAEGKFEQLVGIAEEHGSLTSTDLNIKCSHEMFQNMEIQTGSGVPRWSKDENSKLLAREIIQADQIEDLTEVMGRTATDVELNQKIKEINDIWDRGNNPTAAVAAVSSQADDSDLTKILGESKEEEEEEETEADMADLASLFSGLE